jgi:hypothetical protein
MATKIENKGYTGLQLWVTRGGQRVDVNTGGGTGSYLVGDNYTLGFETDIANGVVSKDSTDNGRRTVSQVGNTGPTGRYQIDGVFTVQDVGSHAWGFSVGEMTPFGPNALEAMKGPLLFTVGIPTSTGGTQQSDSPNIVGTNPFSAFQDAITAGDYSAAAETKILGIPAWMVLTGLGVAAWAKWGKE